MKIAVMGYSGSGKSTLARILSEHYGIPVLHLDTVQFLPGWEIRDDEEKRKIAADFMKKESWVIDGNYTVVSPARFSDCDLFILLLFNRFYCFKKCWLRYKKYKGRPRPDLPCGEKFDFEFAWWILHEGRTRKRRNKFRRLAANAKSALVFKSRRAFKKWLKDENIALELSD